MRSPSKTDYYAKNPKRSLLRSARNRATRLGLEFDINEEDFEIPDTCPVLGIAIKRSTGGQGCVKAESPSIDRIVPSLGYVKGNISIISHRANLLKNNATPEEISKLNDYMQTLKPHYEAP